VAAELLKAILTSYNSAVKHPNMWKTINNVNSVCNGTTMLQYSLFSQD